MKPRAEVAAFIQTQFDPNRKCSLNKGDKSHYGIQDLRELLDFLYGGPPKADDEKLFQKHWFAR